MERAYHNAQIKWTKLFIKNFVSKCEQIRYYCHLIINKVFQYLFETKLYETDQQPEVFYEKGCS